MNTLYDVALQALEALEDKPVRTDTMNEYGIVFTLEDGPARYFDVIAASEAEAIELFRKKYPDGDAQIQYVELY